MASCGRITMHDDKLEGHGVAQMRYYPGICLERLSKTMKTSIRVANVRD